MFDSEVEGFVARMLLAVTYALTDAVNVLLIGVLVVIGVLLPPRSRYNRIATLLIAGDWLGVFLYALVCMLVFDGIGAPIKRLVESSIFGIILIAVGILSAILTWRGGDTSKMMAKILPSLQYPSFKTFATGLVLGVVQSATSVPFYAGIAVLSAGGFSVMIRYVGMVAYASLALSLPVLSALLVGAVRLYPESLAGRFFAWLRAHKEQANAVGGYLVAVVLIVIGIMHV